MKDLQNIITSLTGATTDIARSLAFSGIPESIIKTIEASLPAFETASAKAFSLLGEQDSVSMWKQQTASHWRAKLGDQTDVEMIALLKEHHFGVDYAGGSLLAIEAKTVDGTDHSGAQGSNIGIVDLSLTLHWRSLIRSDGLTELQITLYPATQASPRAKLIRTNAIFTKNKLGDLAKTLVRILCLS